jgi:dihydrofolate synthase / folylpolyglutamate synthase
LPRSIFDHIDRIGARAVQIGRDFHARAVPGAGGSWDFDCGLVTLRDLPTPALAGAPQLANAATALAAICVGGFELALDPGRVGRALRSVRVAGRFQVVPGDVEWVLDVAHNVPAAMVLATNLRQLPKRRTIAVCGILADKDATGITAMLSADVDTWIPVALTGPRALSRDELARRLPEGAAVDSHTGGVASACRRARELAQPGDRIVVFGSFLTVGPALEFLGI